MAALHEALGALSSASFDEVPVDEPRLKEYLQETFSKGQLLIDSVPPPPIDPSIPVTRSRANTASSIASNVSEMSASSARAEALIPTHGLLQKEWGKPLKLSAKENSMGMGVYKLSGKDGRAWFARRSVHEGMPYQKWKKALQNEFPESLQVQGAPGEGNIRGIGAERLVEKKTVKGVGSMEVYHLSAQFPGPTTPRDFVELLLTSSAALNKPTSDESTAELEQDRKRAAFGDIPRHFMVISKPCKHPDCPPRGGFVRGDYESIEFIREVPSKPKKSASTTDLLQPGHSRGASSGMSKEAVLRHARQRSGTLGMSLSRSSEAQSGTETTSNSGFLSELGEHGDGRARGRTISFAESRGFTAKGEALDLASDESADEMTEMSPVEWIMITRSDPGGSVPRFMVERGTPSSIVADASKFVNWACTKEHSEDDEDFPVTNGAEENADEEEEEVSVAGQVQSQVPALDGTVDTPDTRAHEYAQSEVVKAPLPTQPNGFLSSITNAASSTLEAYGPQALLSRLPAQQQDPISSSSLLAKHTSPSPEPSLDSTVPTTRTTSKDPQPYPESDASSTFSSASFASADSHLSSPSEGANHFPSPLSPTNTTTGSSTSNSKSNKTCASPEEREIAKLSVRKAKLDDKLRRTREKETKDKDALTSKEEARIKKAEEKHAKEVKKVEEKFEKDIKALEDKKRRDEEKERKKQEKEDKERVEKKAKEDKVEADKKAKGIGVEAERKAQEEKEAADKVVREEKERMDKEERDRKSILDSIRKERDLLSQTLQKVQMENTALVAALGKLNGGEAVLKAVREEMGSK